MRKTTTKNNATSYHRRSDEVTLDEIEWVLV